jgi:hypothetical protein
MVSGMAFRMIRFSDDGTLLQHPADPPSTETLSFESESP